MAYSLIYSPEIIPFDDDLQFVCSDKRIHFRFRDFNKNEHIQGFEKKLIYLMEYLFNYCYIPSLPNNIRISKENLLRGFMNTSDVKEVTRILSNFVSESKFKGLKAYFNYNHKRDIKPFGEVKEIYFPIKGVNSLLDFQKKLKVKIEDFLFNDQYSILLHGERNKEVNKKYKNKKLNNTTDNLMVKLW